MNTSLEIFYLAAQELNFSRAAEKAFVTQQCLSDHIRRLENTYNVILFQRRPQLKLTPAGKVFLKYVSDMRALENNLQQELCDISSGVSGSLNFGISVTRGNLIIPKLVPAFQNCFPNVDIHVHLDDTKALEPLLLENKLDLFLGIATSEHALFQKRLIAQEPLYLVISQSLFDEHFPNVNEVAIRNSKHEGIELKPFEQIPFVHSYGTSTTAFAINQFLLKNGIHINVPISVSDVNILLALCKSGRYATIILKYQLQQLIDINQTLQEKEQLIVFPIKGFDTVLNVELVSHRDVHMPIYIQEYSKMLESFMRIEYQRIDSILL